MKEFPFDFMNEPEYRQEVEAELRRILPDYLRAAAWLHEHMSEEGKEAMRKAYDILQRGFEQKDQE